MSDNERSGAEIVSEALRETSSFMRQVAVQIRGAESEVKGNIKATDELRREIQRLTTVMGRVETYLKNLVDERESKKTSTTALAKVVKAVVESKAVQFAVLTLVYWFAVKLGVAQYLHLGGSDAP